MDGVSIFLLVLLTLFQLVVPYVGIYVPFTKISTLRRRPIVNSNPALLLSTENGAEHNIDSKDSCGSNGNDSVNLPDNSSEYASLSDNEQTLQLSIKNLEETLRIERLRLAKLKDKKSESGKMGFFMIQAQVNDFTVG